MPSDFTVLCCSTAFLPADAHGGVPYSTFHLCKALTRAGADVRVITTDRNGDKRLDVATDCWTNYEGLPVWYAATSPGPFLFAKSARRVISETVPRVDCVLNSGTLWVHSGWLAWRAARRFGKAQVSYVRGQLDPWAFQHKPLRKQLHWRLLGKRILQDSAAVVALNESEQRSIAALGVTTRIEVIPNGAYAEDVTTTETFGRAWLDEKYPSIAGRRYVLFLGRIHEKKGLDLLLPAAATMLSESNAVAFVIAGPIDPDYRSRWNDLVRLHGLDGRLTMPGAVATTEKAAWLRNADLFVLPSYSEGLPVAALEALSAGCPVVVSTACNLPEVQEADAGLVINADVGELRDAMRALLTDEPRRRAMGARARQLAKERFDWDAIAKRTLALCRELAGSARS